jgi:hypothetical protein
MLLTTDGVFLKKYIYNIKGSYISQLFIYYTMLIKVKVSKVKQSLYTPWRRLGGEEI